METAYRPIDAGSTMLGLRVGSVKHFYGEVLEVKMPRTSGGVNR